MSNDNAAGAGKTSEVESKSVAPTETVTLSKTEVDQLVKAVEEAQQLAEKKSADAENYKSGMLKYKSKLKDNGIEDEEKPTGLTKEDVAAIIKEQLQAILPRVVSQDEEIAKTKKTNSELLLALKTRSTTPPTSMGSNIDKPQVTVSHGFTEQELAEIKKRGLDPAIVAKNARQPGSPRMGGDMPKG